MKFPTFFPLFEIRVQKSRFHRVTSAAGVLSYTAAKIVFFPFPFCSLSGKTIYALIPCWDSASFSRLHSRDSASHFSQKPLAISDNSTFCFASKIRLSDADEYNDLNLFSDASKSLIRDCIRALVNSCSCNCSFSCLFSFLRLPHHAR